MIISPPFLPANGLTPNDPTALDPMMDAVDGFELRHQGIYPIAFDRRWHCGVHLTPNFQGEAVRAIADGEVVAYRVAQKAIADGQSDPDTGAPMLNSNTGFVLLRHTTDTGDGRSMTFYSLYVHLLDVASLQPVIGVPQLPEVGSSSAMGKWLTTPTDGVQTPANKKVYRKDILGYYGKCHGQPHLHFEIFMTEEDFRAWFDQAGHAVQLGKKTPATPDAKDYWGHSYFVIPAGQAFHSSPPDQMAHAAYFPAQQSGTLAEGTLYVEAYFHKGQRYTRSWLDKNGTVTCLTGDQPVRDPYPEYEYKLYARATALYPACPSDGYELLRFGRILSDQPTLPQAAQTTWVDVTFAAGKRGYIDISQGAIQKLSDADFPFFMGWQKIEEGNTPFSQDGLCDYEALRTIINDAEAQETPQPQHEAAEYPHDDMLSAYVRGNASVRNALRGFVCHAPSEWDATGNEARYRRLNDPDGFFGKRKDSDPNGYANFLKFHTQLQFLEKTPLGGGRKFWFFHPLAFVRHFRRCGWLHPKEMAQCFPRKLLHLKLTQFKPSITSWGMAISRAERWIKAFNEGTRKYGLSDQKLRLLHLFSHVIPETGNLDLVKEVDGEERKYSPYYGRGLIQLTHFETYKIYGDFRKFRNNNLPEIFRELGWDPNEIIARDNDGRHNYANCVDSAGFYFVTRKNMLSHLDAGVSQQDAIKVSKDVNGYVAIENLNGLEARLQSAVYLRNILLDEIFGEGEVPITFDWRRHSKRESALTTQGNPVMVGNPSHPRKKYYVTTHHIGVSLDRQKP